MHASLREIEQVTRHFSTFQGLKVVPLGLIMLGYTAGHAGWWTVLAPGSESSLGLLLWVGAAVAYYALQRYYRHQFGRVRRADGDRYRDLFVFVAFLFAIAGVGTLWHRYEWAIDPTGFVFAGLFVWAYLQAPLRRHYLVAASLIAAVTLLPLVGVPLRAVGTIMWGTMAVAFIVGGVLDHLLLVRTLGPRPAEGAEDVEVIGG